MNTPQSQAVAGPVPVGKERLSTLSGDLLNGALAVPTVPVTYTLIPGATNKGKDLLIDSLGYQYNLKVDKRRTTVTWRCCCRSKLLVCKATVVERAGNYIRGGHGHVCGAKPGRDHVKSRKELKKIACKRVFDSAAEIVEEDGEDENDDDDDDEDSEDDEALTAEVSATLQKLKKEREAQAAEQIAWHITEDGDPLKFRPPLSVLPLCSVTMGDSQVNNPDIVKLNVGGVVFITTKTTLCRYPQSMLGAMFNGSMATWRDDSGCYFIDRNGHMFGYILDFLRSSRLALPDDFKQIDQLSVEADFFQIEPLITAINDHKNQTAKKGKKCGKLLEVIEVRIGSTATMPTNNSRVKTIVSGRRDIIAGLPQEFFSCPVEKLEKASDQLSFTEIELVGSNVRLRLADYLLSEGWEMMRSDLSSSSGYDTKSMISSLIIEQSYRDRWFISDTDPDLGAS